MAVKLTKGVVEAATAELGADGARRVTYLFDSEKPGLALKIAPTGAKSFIYQARVGSGRGAKKTRRLIGRWPATTVDAARKAAEKWHSKVRVQGVDPAAERVQEQEKRVQEAADKRTVNEVCDAYLQAAITMPTKRGRPKSATSLKIDSGRIRWHVRPLLGNKLVKSLTKGDIANFRDKVAAGETAKTVKSEKKRGKYVIEGGEGTANRVLNLLGAVMSYAKDQRWIAENPVSGVVKFHRSRVGKRPPAEQVKAIGAQLRAIETDHPEAVAIIRALALTGARYSEIAKLRHKWMELPGALLRIPDTANKSQRERLIILGKRATDILGAQRKMLHNPFVFPAIRAKTHYQGLPKIWNKVREKAEVDFRLHDWRHHFASVANDMGYPEAIVSALLGHSRAGTTQGYIHTAPKALRDAADAISEAIGRLLDGTTAEVIRLPREDAR
jgi:integrase